MKRIIKWTLWLLTLGVLFVCFSNWAVYSSTKDNVIADIDELAEKKVALVLGTSKRTSRGTENQYFKDRIQAAAELYKRGKVKHIIVSGDNRSKYYNEPRDMLQALELKGIPEDAITLDYAGLRTLDTVVRCREIFGQTEVIIVTQRFHGYRAQFIANRFQMNAQVYAPDTQTKPFRSLLIREFIARPLAVSDLYVFKRSPKYLGEKIELNIE